MQEKRRKEQLRKQKQQEKEQRRLKRIAENQNRPKSVTGQDPDLEEMGPGPQPGQIV